MTATASPPAKSLDATLRPTPPITATEWKELSRRASFAAGASACRINVTPPALISSGHTPRIIERCT